MLQGLCNKILGNNRRRNLGLRSDPLGLLVELSFGTRYAEAFHF